MHYNYEKLKQNHILDAINAQISTRELDVMLGTDMDIIRLGNGYTFLVQDGELSYYNGLSKATALDLERLSKVMSILQTAITLECPIFEDDREANYA